MGCSGAGEGPEGMIEAKQQDATVDAAGPIPPLPHAAPAPAISVVIPHMNQPEHLARCLAALAGQAEAPGFDVTVVDNGSREPPEALCARYGARLIHEKTPGPGPARNAGIAASSAPLLAFIDADCIAHPRWLAAIAGAFEDPAKRILGGDVRIWREAPGAPTPLECYESVYAYQMRDYIRRKGFTGTGNLAVRRETFENIGPFAGIGTAEDIDWGRRATAAGQRIHYVPEAVAWHPARKSMAELQEKWDRHLAHFYEDARGSRAGRVKWVATAGAVLLSPLPELWRIARSDRIFGARERMAAFGVMARLRVYRARRMLSLAASGDGAALSGAWNRR